MTLAALIRKSKSGKVATAIPAIPATDDPGRPATVATIATVAVANPESARADAPCRDWLLHFADREPLEVIFSDDLTHGEVLALYPAAIAAIPWQEVTAAAQPATEPAPADPLPTCEGCRNLTMLRDHDGFRRCIAATRRYNPVPDIGRRCENYLAARDDRDQRTGRERWPWLDRTSDPDTAAGKADRSTW